MKKLQWILLVALCLGVAGYAAFAYGFTPLGSLVHPDMQKSFLQHDTAIYLHAFASIAALVLGPFQFSGKLRKARPVIHRWMGRLYLFVGVLMGGLAGLYLARYAYGGIVAKLGFATLASCWLYSGFRAYQSIRHGAIAEHQKWMLRNFALTLAAVTLRIYIPLSMVIGIDFAVAYAIIAWLCWLPNIIYVQWRHVHSTR